MKLMQRQSTTPLSYNVTQSFSAAANTRYRFSAFAAEAQNGASPPNCFLTICGNDDCGSSNSLTSDYTQYSYSYLPTKADNNSVATFEVMCSSKAYLALDNVTVVSDIGNNDQDNTVTTILTKYGTLTMTVVQIQTIIEIQTRTQVSGVEKDVTITVPTVIYSTATIEVGVTDTEILSITTTVPTVIYTTETAEVFISATKYLNITTTDISTVTSKPWLFYILDSLTSCPLFRSWRLRY